MIYFESVVDLGFQFIKLWPSKKIIKLWTGHVEKKNQRLPYVPLLCVRNLIQLPYSMFFLINEFNRWIQV